MWYLVISRHGFSSSRHLRRLYYCRDTAGMTSSKDEQWLEMTSKNIFSENTIYFLSNKKIWVKNLVRLGKTDFFNISGVFCDFWWFFPKTQNFQKIFEFKCLMRFFIKILISIKYIIYYVHIGLLVISRLYSSLVLVLPSVFSPFKLHVESCEKTSNKDE